VSILVTVLDEQTGDTESTRVEDGDYLLICVDPCHLTYQQHYPTSGKAQLTIAGRTAKGSNHDRT
jgi:hypothetical protein